MDATRSDTQAIIELDRELNELEAIDRELRDLELIDFELRDVGERWHESGPRIGAHGSDARVMRVSANYFTPAHFPGETDWWAKQLSGR